MSGLRCAARRKRSSSVARVPGAVARIVWRGSPRIMRTSLRGAPPPGFWQIAIERHRAGMLDMRPMSHPLRRDAEQRHSIKSRREHAIFSADGRDEVGAVIRLQHGSDRSVDGGALYSHVVAGAFGLGRGGAEIEALFVARRQRLIPAKKNHIEIIAHA